MRSVLSAYSLLVAVALLILPSFARADDTADQLVAQSRRAFDSGDSAGALALAEKAIAAAPMQARYLLHRAALFDALRQWEKAIADCDAALKLSPPPPIEAAIVQRRGSDHFRLGHIDQSIKDFDRFLELRPEESAGHWQRGISLYYAGRFDDGRKQFELHKTVNPDDVENAAWHFLCVARVLGIEKARGVLLHIDLEADQRVPMRQIYALYEGKAKPEDVLAAAQIGEGDRLKHQLMYAHLHLGLYYEVVGSAALARQHLDLAAGKYSTDDYMGDVAKVHAAMLGAREARQKSGDVGTKN